LETFGTEIFRDREGKKQLNLWLLSNFETTQKPIFVFHDGQTFCNVSSILANTKKIGWFARICQKIANQIPEVKFINIYAEIFHTKVLCKVTFWLCNFLAQKYRHKRFA